MIPPEPSEKGWPVKIKSYLTVKTQHPHACINHPIAHYSLQLIRISARIVVACYAGSKYPTTGPLPSDPIGINSYNPSVNVYNSWLEGSGLFDGLQEGSSQELSRNKMVMLSTGSFSAGILMSAISAQQRIADHGLRTIFNLPQRDPFPVPKEPLFGEGKPVPKGSLRLGSGQSTIFNAPIPDHQSPAPSP